MLRTLSHLISLSQMGGEHYKRATNRPHKICYAVFAGNPDKRPLLRLKGNRKSAKVNYSRLIKIATRIACNVWGKEEQSTNKCS